MTNYFGAFFSAKNIQGAAAYNTVCIYASELIENIINTYICIAAHIVTLDKRKQVLSTVENNRVFTKKSVYFLLSTSPY